jgi:hypothetical protein
MLVERERMRFLYLNRRMAIAPAVLLLGLSLAACASSNPSLMDAHAEAPTSTKQTMAVEDIPTREKPAMTADEQAKLKKQLIDMRERQAATAKARETRGGN